jgi:hypothetical protein
VAESTPGPQCGCFSVGYLTTLTIPRLFIFGFSHTVPAFDITYRDRKKTSISLSFVEMNTQNCINHPERVTDKMLPKLILHRKPKDAESEEELGED